MMNHNIFNKICDKIELPKVVYMATIKKHDDLGGRSIDTAYFYKRDDALDYIKFHYMHRFSEGQKREVTFSHVDNMWTHINQMKEYNLLVEPPTFRNLTDEQKACKVFDTIFRENLQNDDLVLNDNFGYIIVTKSVK